MSGSTLLPSVILAILIGVSVSSFAQQPPAAPEQATGHGTFRVDLPPPAAPDQLLEDSPFGINMALRPDARDFDQRLDALQQAGIKWGRQDFTWRRIEREPGVYDWEPYDKLVEESLAHGIMLFGNFAYAPEFHDPRTPEGVEAYCRFAAEAVRRYKGKIDYWQIWNEPNGGFWNGTPEQYAALLAASGKAIHEANPEAKVLGLNTAFIDILWTDKILSLVPYDCFDIACVHPYRVMAAPEDQMDWWQKDQYIASWHPELVDQNWPLIQMSFLEQVNELDKVMRKYGEPKPIWVTEICWNTNIHPYGTPEIRQADMVVRFQVLAIASQRVQKVFWWTFKDSGDQQFDMGHMVGFVRANYEPKYSYYAYAFMTRMLEGKKWVRNIRMGPDVFLVLFEDPENDQEILVAWANKPYAYIRVNNTPEQGLAFYDVFGTRRFVPFDQQRTSNLPVPLGQSPIYIVGAPGLTPTVRPDPGW